MLLNSTILTFKIFLLYYSTLRLHIFLVNFWVFIHYSKLGL